MGITATVKNYSITDVTFDSVSGLLFQGQDDIPETSYFQPAGCTFGPEAARSGLRHEADSEDFIIGYNNVHRSYQHWLTQCLPAIDWSLRQPRDRGVRLVLPPLEAWQEDLLDLLGYGGVPRLTLEPGMVYHLPYVEYSDFLNGSVAFRVSLAVKDTARRILARLPSMKSTSPLLFLPEPDTYHGSMRNPEEVRDLLNRRGICIIDERLSTVERINLFRHADVVIGSHSDGLADALFCKPGALLWEWMPKHRQNASINRLAQAADLDYWGDLFESDVSSDVSGQWVVDIPTLAERLNEISVRQPAPLVGRPGTSRGNDSPSSVPIDELMMAFESLGDNCEFGLVQRHAGVEPLALLRFAGVSIERLVAGLKSGFAGLGSIDTITVRPGGEPLHRGAREYFVHEASLNMRYHTFRLEDEIDPIELRQSEAKRLGFLRRKILEDLAVGAKIWVWRAWGMTDPAEVQPLVNALRILGPNILLWVVGADDQHSPGKVERLDHDFLKGYVERLAPYENATDIRPASWFEVCQAAYNLCHPNEIQPEKGEPIAVLSPRILSAMEFLTLNQSASRLASHVPSDNRQNWFARWRLWLGF